MVIRKVRSLLRKALGENSHEADWIITSVTQLSQTDFILNTREITDEELCQIDKIVKRRTGGEPLQYILGETEFMGLLFKVDKHTLIPRADTETLVQSVAEKIQNEKVALLDIGTGSGCVGVSIAKFCDNVRATLLDISEGALKKAAENAKLNDVKVDLIRCDIMHDSVDKLFDVVVSNPPYINSDVVPTLDSTVKDYEPITALDGGFDGLTFYRRITFLAKEKILKKGGLLAYEIGFDQGKSVLTIMENAGFENVSLIKDLCGNDRVVLGYKK